MSAFLIKSICQEFQDAVGGNKAAAHIAGVSQGVWSNYCSFDEPDRTLPLHRALLIEQKTGKRWFARVWDDLGSAEAGDPRQTAAAALQSLSAAISSLTEAYSDGVLTEAERRQIIGDVQRLIDTAFKLGVDVAAAPSGPPYLKPAA